MIVAAIVLVIATIAVCFSSALIRITQKFLNGDYD